MKNQKSMWAIYHGYEEDGGFGDAIHGEDMVGIVEATEEEINAFVEKWDKPVTYSKPYDYLTCHQIRASKIELTTLDKLKPYGEDDFYGKLAEEYEYGIEFEKEHGDNWRFHDPDESLHKLYYEGLEKIRNEGGAP